MTSPVGALGLLLFGALAVAAQEQRGSDEAGREAGEERADEPSAARGTPHPESPYARWSQGPPTDPAWFPIGVWLQDPALASRYRALGVNTFVGLWQGPTEEQLAQLSRAGMKVVCRANPAGLQHRPAGDIIAWMQTDEPENKSDERRGPRATVAEAEALYDRLRRLDPTRPVWMNLGQGVANDDWRGAAAPRSDYPRYVRAADIVSFDVYPVSNLRRRDGENYLWYVAKGVRRLREWGADERIVWNVIETTRGHGERQPTPAQVRSEVWLSLVAGSRGIVYFCHAFGGEGSSAELLLDAEMCAALTRLNREIRRLAPVLNGPTLEGRVRVISSTERVPVATLVKQHDGALYVFAISERNASTDARLVLSGLGAATEERHVQVLGEGRTCLLEQAPGADRGAFTDRFEPYALHIYRIR